MNDMGFVYIIQEDYSFRYKIGKTKKLRDRMHLFAVKLPFGIESIHTIYCDNYHYLERYLHEHFKEKRVRGEWFELTNHDIEWIKSEIYLKNTTNKIDKKVAIDIKDYIQNASANSENIEEIFKNRNSSDDVKDWYSEIETSILSLSDMIWVKPGKVFINFYSPNKVFASIRIWGKNISLEVFSGDQMIPGTYQTEKEVNQRRSWSRFKIYKNEDVEKAIGHIKASFNIVQNQSMNF